MNSEQILQIATSAGTMETFVATPGQRARGTIILYMDVWGIREELRTIARDVASNGYACYLPDLFYRMGRIRHEFIDENGRMRTLLSLTPEQQEQVRTPMRGLSDEMVMDDTRVLLAAIGESEQLVAAMGYCMGGRHALVAGGTLPGRIKVAACLHGSNLVNDSETSPHLVASRIKGEAYCGFAELDPFGSPDVLEKIKDQFSRAGARLSYAVHTGAQHGYALPERDVHDPEATKRDWMKIYSMLAAH